MLWQHMHYGEQDKTERVCVCVCVCVCVVRVESTVITMARSEGMTTLMPLCLPVMVYSKYRSEFIHLMPKSFLY